MQEEKENKKEREVPWFGCSRKMKKMENATLGSNMVLSQIVGPIGNIVSRA